LNKKLFIFLKIKKKKKSRAGTKLLKKQKMLVKKYQKKNTEKKISFRLGSVQGNYDLMETSFFG